MVLGESDRYTDPYPSKVIAKRIPTAFYDRVTIDAKRTFKKHQAFEVWWSLIAARIEARRLYLPEHLKGEVQFSVRGARCALFHLVVDGPKTRAGAGLARAPTTWVALNEAELQLVLSYELPEPGALEVSGAAELFRSLLFWLSEGRAPSLVHNPMGLTKTAMLKSCPELSDRSITLAPGAPSKILYALSNIRGRAAQPLDAITLLLGMLRQDLEFKEARRADTQMVITAIWERLLGLQNQARRTWSKAGARDASARSAQLATLKGALFALELFAGFGDFSLVTPRKVRAAV